MGESAKEKAARKILESGPPAETVAELPPGAGLAVFEMPMTLLEAELGKTPKRGKSRLKKKS